MENFFYGEEFYREIGDLIDDISETEDLSDISEDWKITCEYATLEPIFKLDADWIMNRINDERFSEEGRESDDVYEILNQLDYSQVNERMPKLYYPNGKKFDITKQDLLDYCK